MAPGYSRRAVSLPSRLSSALPVALVLAALACTSAPGTRGAGHAGSMADASADPGAIPAWFDAHREHPRAILLLSPV